MHSLSEQVKVTFDKHFGRHLVATKNINAGEVILVEKPLLITPHWENEIMKCADCYQDSFVICRKCQVFPLCIDCTDHDEFDCAFFRNIAPDLSKDILVKNYAIQPVLKLLLLMENPIMRDACDMLRGKKLILDKQRNTELWREHATNVVTPILQSGIAKYIKKQPLTAEFLQELCFLLDVNAFEVTAKDGDSLKGVYPGAAQLAHSCVPNAVISFNDKFQMKVYAAVPIQSGEIIFNSFVNPLMGTHQRQHQMRMSQIMEIECACKRCCDPTELDTHMSSLRCQHCEDGYAVCQAPPNDADWKCMDCGAVIELKNVRKLITKVGEEMYEASGDVCAYEALICKYSSHLHTNHFLMVDMKQNIASILRGILMNPMCNPDKQLLRGKVQLCEEILPVVRAVLPGISKLYGIALYEYLLSYVELAEIEFEEGDIPSLSYYEKLYKAQEIAEEAAGMLRYEPENSPEGHLARRVTMEERRIHENMLKQSGKPALLEVDTELNKE